MHGRDVIFSHSGFGTFGLCFSIPVIETELDSSSQFRTWPAQKTVSEGTQQPHPGVELVRMVQAELARNQEPSRFRSRPA